MKPTNHNNSIFLLAFAILLCVACSHEKKNTATKNNNISENKSLTIENGNEFIYHFGDASLPPKYHRSYTIRVIPGQVYCTIDRYGDILLTDSSALTTAAYDSFVKNITALQIKNKTADSEKGCTGGTSKQLTLFAGGTKEIKGSLYYCGGQINGNLDGDVVAAAKFFTDLVPDLEKKIAATKTDN
jgi:hypothetical protein